MPAFFLAVRVSLYIPLFTCIYFLLSFPLTFPSRQEVRHQKAPKSFGVFRICVLLHMFTRWTGLVRCPPASLSVYLSVCLSVFLYLSTCLFIRLFLHLSSWLTVYDNVLQTVWFLRLHFSSDDSFDLPLYSSVRMSVTFVIDQIILNFNQLITS